MHAYLQLRAELRSGKTTTVDLAARSAERDLQQAESIAWKTRTQRGR